MSRNTPISLQSFRAARPAWLLLLSLVLQVVAPGLASPAFSAPAPPGAMAVCTAEGIHYVLPDGTDGQGKAAGKIACVFCLPVMGGHLLAASPGDSFVWMPAPPRRHAMPRDTFVAESTPARAVHPPRAPPVRSA